VLLALIDKYIIILDRTQEKTVTFLNWMNSNATKFITSPDETNEYVQRYIAEEFSVSGKELIEVQEKMFREMRRELGIV
jgi:hypothetical protein